MNSRFILKVDPVEIADGLDVGNMRKRKDKGDSWALVLSQWKYGVPLLRWRKPLEEWVWEEGGVGNNRSSIWIHKVGEAYYTSK